MHVPTVATVMLAFFGSSQLVAGAAVARQAEDLLLSLNDQALTALEEVADNSTAVVKSRSESRGCNLFNAQVRKDWSSLSKQERKNYIKAVKCIRSLPSKTDPALVPGARTRYDDFVAVHINQTLSIHGTGNFLTWHRYITWAYENALRTECGYTGTQPYWNWFSYQSNPTKSPVFDGSDTSMGGDGDFLQHNGTQGAPGIELPSGNGGGCMTKGPFAGDTARLGPVSPGQRGLAANPNGPLGFFPRCLSRDLNSYALTKFMTYANLYNITLGAASGSVAAFQSELQGRFGDGFLGMHATGHMAIGGEATDLFSSINDPSFFLHHAMVDRVYWLWQALHLNQANTVGGTITINNNPPSRNALVTDIVNLGILAPSRTISELHNTLGGSPFCYIYV